ncbi:MAG: hypothetical protein AAF587_18375 [Bacteroidota bacterium]
MKFQFLLSLLIGWQISVLGIGAPTSISSKDTNDYQLILIDPQADKEISLPTGGWFLAKDKIGRKYSGTIVAYSKEAVLLKSEKVEMENLVFIKYYPKGRKWRSKVGGILKLVSLIFFIKPKALFGPFASPEVIYSIEKLYPFPGYLFVLPFFLLGMFISRGHKYNLKRKFDWYMQIKTND